MMKSDFFNHLLNLTETCTHNKLKKENLINTSNYLSILLSVVLFDPLFTSSHFMTIKNDNNVVKSNQMKFILTSLTSQINIRCVTFTH